MKGRGLLVIAGLCAVVVLALSLWLAVAGPSRDGALLPVPTIAATPPARAEDVAPGPALPVRTVQAQRQRWVDRLAASGAVAPAQELGVGTDLAGARVRELAVHPGDRVRRGQILAVLEAPALMAEAAGAEAALREATVQWEAARDQWQRARLLHPSGAVSTQLLSELTTAEATAAARLQAQHVRVGAEQDRRRALQVRAPVDGLVLKREAVVGTVTQAGQELYRLVPGAAMLWRAELPSSALVRVQAGQLATVVSPDGRALSGRVRGIAPALDPVTRQGLVEVTLSADAAWRIGDVVRGHLALGEREGWTLPSAAVQTADGHSRVFVVTSEGRARAVTVQVGQHLGDGRLEILQGLLPEAAVIAEGQAFVVDGAAVRIVP